MHHHSMREKCQNCTLYMWIVVWQMPRHLRIEYMKYSKALFYSISYSSATCVTFIQLPSSRTNSFISLCAYFLCWYSPDTINPHLKCLLLGLGAQKHTAIPLVWFSWLFSSHNKIVAFRVYLWFLIIQITTGAANRLIAIWDKKICSSVWFPESELIWKI